MGVRDRVEDEAPCLDRDRVRVLEPVGDALARVPVAVRVGDPRRVFVPLRLTVDAADVLDEGTAVRDCDGARLALPLPLMDVEGEGSADSVPVALKDCVSDGVNDCEGTGLAVTVALTLQLLVGVPLLVAEKDGVPLMDAGRVALRLPLNELLLL